MLAAYEREAADHLAGVLAHMRLAWPIVAGAD